MPKDLSNQLSLNASGNWGTKHWTLKLSIFIRKSLKNPKITIASSHFNVFNEFFMIFYFNLMGMSRNVIFKYRETHTGKVLCFGYPNMLLLFLGSFFLNFQRPLENRSHQYFLIFSTFSKQFFIKKKISQCNVFFFEKKRYNILLWPKYCIFYNFFFGKRFSKYQRIFPENLKSLPLIEKEIQKIKETWLEKNSFFLFWHIFQIFSSYFCKHFFDFFDWFFGTKIWISSQPFFQMRSMTPHFFCFSKLYMMGLVLEKNPKFKKSSGVATHAKNDFGRDYTDLAQIAQIKHQVRYTRR